MATKRYRWVKTWCLMGEPGELNPGDEVEVQKADGTVQHVTVDNVLPFTTKAGKAKVRAFVHQEAAS